MFFYHLSTLRRCNLHDDVIKWKHFLCYWPFVTGDHRSQVDSPQRRPVTRNFDVFFDLRMNKDLANNRIAGNTSAATIIRPSSIRIKTTSRKITFFPGHLSWQITMLFAENTPGISEQFTICNGSHEQTILWWISDGCCCVITLPVRGSYYDSCRWVIWLPSETHLTTPTKHWTNMQHCTLL